MAAEPAHLEPVLRSGRGHNSERPAYHKNKQNKNICKTGFGWVGEVLLARWYLVAERVNKQWKLHVCSAVPIERTSVSLKEYNTMAAV